MQMVGALLLQEVWFRKAVTYREEKTKQKTTKGTACGLLLMRCWLSMAPASIQCAAWLKPCTGVLGVDLSGLVVHQCCWGVVASG